MASQNSFSRFFYRESAPASQPDSPTWSSAFSSQSSFGHSIPNKATRKRKLTFDISEDILESEAPESPSDELCPHCRQFDLSKAVSVGIDTLQKSEDGILIANVGKRFRDPLLEEECSLCQILFASRLEAKNQQGTNDELRAFPFLRYFSDIKDDHKSWRLFLDHNQLFFLAVVPSQFTWFRYAFGFEYRTLFGQNGYALCFNESHGQIDAFAARIIPRRFEPAVALRWLQYCKRRHKKLCGLTVAKDSNLKLIDCDTLEIVPARPSHPYVALSYVWGASATTGQSISSTSVGGMPKLPSSLPNVIADAITVTSALHLRYLWVDKYCIDQDNPQTKHDQIKQMDSIYANAELTIVAAAGDDETFGLPGVGKQERSPQLSARHADSRVISTLTHPHQRILTSKWSTRGWTYQEAVLSRRRLVFTSEQMYFECNAMNCYESISSSLDLLHTKNRAQFRGCMRAGIFGRKHTHAFGHFDVENLAKDGTFIRYLNHVESYTARDLRYDSDSLHAFAGIIRRFETMKMSLPQLWGVSYLHPRTGERMESKEYDRYLSDALCWNHQSSCWDPENLPRRRLRIPSWSWAGWAGAVEYQHRDYFEAVTFVSEIQNIQLEHKDGQLIDYRKALEASEDTRHGFLRPRALLFEARAIPPTAFSLSQNSKAIPELKVFNWSTSFTFSCGPKSPMEALEGFKKERLQCLFIGWQGPHNFFMIIQSSGEVSTRIGLMTVENSMVIESTPKRQFRIE